MEFQIVSKLFLDTFGGAAGAGARALNLFGAPGVGLAGA